jgi:anti-anti-sigma factor
MPDDIDKWVDIRQQWTATVVHFHGNIYDANAIESVRVHLMRMVESEGCTHMVLDMSNVTHASSIFLGMILQLSLKLSRLKGALRIACMTRDVRDMFDLMRVGDVVQVHDNVNTAAKSF